MNDENHYRAYLLRLQRGQDQPYWRVTLQNAQTGEIMNFATERALLNYLLNSLSLDNGNPGSDTPVPNQFSVDDCQRQPPLKTVY